MCTLNSTQGKAYRVGYGCAAVYVLQLETYCDKMLYECYAVEGHYKFVCFNVWVC
jgi:hypothetical protein